MSTTTVCEFCGDSFEARHATARFCSDRCRQRAHRLGQEAAEGLSKPGPVELAVRADMVAYQASGTVKGEVAIALATGLDRSKVGQAALARELLALLSTIRVYGTQSPRQ